MSGNLRDLVLINQYFVSSFPERKEEINKTIKMNSVHPSFTKYLILLEKEEDIKPLKELINVDNHIEILNVGKRTNFSDIFQLTLERKDLYDKVCIYSNADIFFDNTIDQLKKLTSKQFICLSRRELNNGKPVDMSREKCKSSQDLWAFVNPIDSRAIEATDFLNGHWGCDNRIAYEMYNLGYTLFNPYSIVKIYHNHASNQGRPGNNVRLEGKYLRVFPCKSLLTPSRLRLSSYYKKYGYSNYNIINQQKKLKKQPQPQPQPSEVKKQQQQPQPSEVKKQPQPSKLKKQQPQPSKLKKQQQ